MKTAIPYWNPLAPGASGWEDVPGWEGVLWQCTLATDPVTGDYTRLTRFAAGADTSAGGAKVHDYPEEVFIVSGRIYDAASDRWLEPGTYASRPPGEVHGPFRAEGEVIVLEMSCPAR